MLCEKCGKRMANTHIHTVINGNVYDKNLCEQCAMEQGVNLYPQNSLSDMLASMFMGLRDDRPQNEKRCPVCGATFGDVANSGKAGCAECYNTFKNELLPYLKRVHGSTKHIGKTPDNISFTEIPQRDGIAELREELNRLIAEENYEQAAVIRDKIKEMEAQNNG